MTHKSENIFYLALYRKSLPTPGLVHYNPQTLFQKCVGSIYIFLKNLIVKNLN